ncbi:MAG: hypothetical protein OEW52_12890 [Thermoleophilia bacterium]|nr:hypothetical protein [Thermoleophilia bacterium]MDH5282019.1 hypothetical protein [Thermoleophilia bacterium]
MLAAAILTAVAAAMFLAPRAAAYHTWTEFTYWSGNLTPQEGRGSAYGNICGAVWGSRSNWTVGSGRVVVVALINTSGGWVKSARSSTGGQVGVTVTPGPVLKAHCKNDGTVTFSQTCRYLWAYSDNPCA